MGPVGGWGEGGMSRQLSAPGQLVKKTRTPRKISDVTGMRSFELTSDVRRDDMNGDQIDAVARTVVRSSGEDASTSVHGNITCTGLETDEARLVPSCDADDQSNDEMEMTISVKLSEGSLSELNLGNEMGLDGKTAKVMYEQLSDSRTDLDHEEAFELDYTVIEEPDFQSTISESPNQSRRDVNVIKVDDDVITMRVSVQSLVDDVIVAEG